MDPNDGALARPAAGDTGQPEATGDGSGALGHLREAGHGGYPAEHNGPGAVARIDDHDITADLRDDALDGPMTSDLDHDRIRRAQAVEQRDLGALSACEVLCGGVVVHRVHGIGLVLQAGEQRFHRVEGALIARARFFHSRSVGG